MTAEPTYMSDDEITSMGIVRSNMIWATGLGAVAIPIFDLTAVTLVNLKMINSLTNHYEIPFSENLGKNLLASMFSGFTAKTLATGFLGSTIKAIPGLGQVFGAVAVPVFSGALTYAIGTVFVQHFESGGTLLDFDPNKTRAALREAYEQGKKQVAKAPASRKKVPVMTLPDPNGSVSEKKTSARASKTRTSPKTSPSKDSSAKSSGSKGSGSKASGSKTSSTKATAAKTGSETAEKQVIEKMPKPAAAKKTEPAESAGVEPVESTAEKVIENKKPEPTRSETRKSAKMGPAGKKSSVGDQTRAKVDPQKKRETGSGAEKADRSAGPLGKMRKEPKS